MYEDYYINFYDSINHGYNIIMGGKDAFIKLYKPQKQPIKEEKVDLYCKISKSGRFYWKVYKKRQLCVDWCKRIVDDDSKGFGRHFLTVC